MADTRTVKEVMDLPQNQGGCDTGKVRKLSHEIIAEMNLLIPNVLVDIADLPVHADSRVNLFLQAPAKQGLRAAIQDRGRSLTIISAYRTCAQQVLLRGWFLDGRCGIPKAAKPGLSNHEDGLAVDIEDHNGWKPFLIDHGWVWFGSSDRTHFSYHGAGRRDDVGSIGVKAFQRLWNRHHPADRVAEDGDFGPQTEARMLKSPADGFGALRLLQLATPRLRGDDVKRVQEALRTAGLHDVPVDGIFSASTDRAVRQFQETQELAVDGIVGPSTRRELGILP
jgi:hypothetical protein